MTPSVGKKLSLFVATVVLLATAGMGYVSYRLMEGRFAEVLRKDTLDNATLLSSRVRNELRHVAEKGRILAAAALEEFKNPDDQIRFLEDNLSIDDQYIAMSLFRRSKTSQGQWSPVFRLTRPEGDPAHIEDSDFKQFDLKYPLDLNLVSEGAVEVSVGALKDGTPILRMAVPIVRKKGVGFTQLLEMEVRQERLTAAFAEATAHFSFILDRNGRVLTQTDPTHFTLGEDLSHLPILQAARATDAPNGNLDYYELPGGPLQYGSFHKVGYADLTVVSQAPSTLVLAMLREYTRRALYMGFACLFLAAALTLIASWGIIGVRLRRIGNAIARIGDGKFHVKFPEVLTEDELGEFARKLQSVCDQLEAREKVHGTFAKLKGKKVKALIEDGKINLKGERHKAMVLHCHLGGIENVAGKAEPELLIQLLNEFNQSVSETIEKSQGIVDHVHGGSVVAYWGVPIASKEDADNALASCLEIREMARAFNETLTHHRLPNVTLGMGMHYGPVIAGQVGTADRLEYTAIGEAIEVAARIHGFVDQFGTDFLMTGPAAQQAPEWYSTEQVSSGDENSPELFELVGTAARKTKAASMPPDAVVESGVPPEPPAEEQAALPSPEDASPFGQVEADEGEAGIPTSSEDPVISAVAEPPSESVVAMEKKKRRRRKKLPSEDSGEEAA